MGYLYHIGRVLLLILILVEPVLIVMAKNHYTVDMVVGVVVAAMAFRLYDHEVGPDARPAHFIEAYKEAKRQQPSSQASEEKKAALLNMNEKEFAEHVQYAGSTIGGVVMVLICVSFIGLVGMTFLALLGH